MEEIPEKYRKDLEIIRETGLQIEKDLNHPDFKINFSGIPEQAFDELKNQLIPVIGDLIKSESKFQAVLYRVDISEKEFVKVLSVQSEEQRTSEIAEMIIRREFKKVLTRKYFQG